MIQLTRINHVPMVLNSDLIEHIESTPDTVISLTNGQKILVLENPEQIIERVIQFRRGCAGQSPNYKPFTNSVRRTDAEITLNQTEGRE